MGLEQQLGWPHRGSRIRATVNTETWDAPAAFSAAAIDWACPPLRPETDRGKGEPLAEWGSDQGGYSPIEEGKGCRVQHP